MSDAAGEVERFIGNIAANRKERKPIRPTIVEVRSHTFLFRRHKFSHFIKLINIPVAQMVEHATSNGYGFKSQRMHELIEMYALNASHFG